MPTEIHEHFDTDDNLTGYTVITRESAWDAETRGRALRLVEYEESLCGCGCGQPTTVAYKKQPFKVDQFTCYAGRAKAQAERTWRDEHKGSPDGWNDGVHHYVVPHDNDDEKEATWPPSAE